MTYTLSNSQIILLSLLLVWELVWKGLAMWRAAHRNEPIWFGVLLVVNTAGLLPILYLLFTSKPKNSIQK